MNDQENVMSIQRTYAAFNAGDLEGILAGVAENAEWTNYGPSTVPYCGEFQGRIRAFFEAIASSTIDGKVTADHFIAQGDSVVATGRYTAKVRDTGAQIDTPVAHVFTVRDGKITKWTGYSDTAKVAEAHTRALAARG